MKFFICLLVLNFSTSVAFAQNTETCSSVNQASAVGTRCQTSKGFEFVRVENGWSDKNGKTWYDEMKRDTNQYDSEKYCNDSGKVLPSKGDFELVESHGIREVFKDLNDRWFWSSSITPDHLDGAYYMDGRYGYVDFVSHEVRYDNHSARCVSR